MHFIYDNLVALIVGSVITLAIATMTVQNLEPKIQSHRYYNMRVHMNTLVEVMRKDLANIGSGASPGEQMVFAPVTAGDSLTQSFQFRSAQSVEGSVVQENVRYELNEVSGGCEINEGKTVPCYELDRLLCDELFASCDPGGGSIPSITGFYVSLLDGEGDETNDPVEARGVKVRLAAVSPDGGTSVVPQVRWESSFRPPNLARQ